MLTILQIKALSPTQKLYRALDSDGLHVAVSPKGSKTWQYRYRYAGKEQIATLGKFPLISLAEARQRRDEAKRALALGKNPIDAFGFRGKQQRQELETRFSAYALVWLEAKKGDVKPKTFQKMKTIIEGDLIPALKDTSVKTLNTAQVTPVIQGIADRAPHMAQKAITYLHQMMEAAIQAGLRDDEKVLRLKALVKLKKAVNQPAAVTHKDLAHVLKAIDKYPSEMVRTALHLATLTVLRPSNVVQARWEQVDMAAKTLTVPADEMKTEVEHTVSLPTQAMALLEVAAGWNPKRTGWIFPALSKQKTPHLHRDTLSKALRTIGLQGKQTPHGFRSSFRTLMGEDYDHDREVLESQLAHSVGSETERAYNRAKYLKKLEPIMQKWADDLDGLRNTAQP